MSDDKNPTNTAEGKSELTAVVMPCSCYPEHCEHYNDHGPCWCEPSIEEIGDSRIITHNRAN